MDEECIDQYFWPKVRKSHGCWEWTAATNSVGYGMLRVRGQRWSAHRLSYTIHHGRIPDGQLVRHRCDNRLCVRPDHLEIGTHADNSRDMIERGRSPRNPKAANTHCSNGHPFDEVNTYWWNGSRQCKTCKQEYNVKRSIRTGATARSNRVVGEAREAMKALVAEKYTAGDSLETIGGVLGRSTALIRDLLDEAGVERRRRPRKEAP